MSKAPKQTKAMLNALKLEKEMSKEVAVVEEFDKDEVVMPETLFGTGEFAITVKNIVRLTEALKEYNESNIWKWSLYDSIGINKNGKSGKKFEEVKATFSEMETAEAKAFSAELNKVVAKEESQIVYNQRPSSEEKSKLKAEEEKAKAEKRATVEKELRKIKGLTDVQIAKMLKAI